MSKIRILIADDHDLVREGITARLSMTDDIDVCGEASNGPDVIAKAKELKPDIIFLDISMPKMTGLEAATQILKDTPNTKIIFLSIYDNSEYINEALRIGAKGYMLKDVSREEMALAMYMVYTGGTYLGSKVAASFGKEDSEENSDEFDFNLTKREQEILRRIAEGTPNREIADSLNISVRTVESHRMSLREKTGGGNAADLFRIAKDLGLVS
ncbi:MAG: response regulator [Nitratireductor sp.]